MKTNSSRFQYSRNLGKSLVVVLYMLQNLIRDYDVEELICKGESIRLSLNKTNQVLTTKTFRIGAFLEGEITAERLVGECPILFEDGAMSAAQIEHSQTRFELAA